MKRVILATLDVVPLLFPKISIFSMNFTSVTDGFRLSNEIFYMLNSKLFS